MTDSDSPGARPIQLDAKRGEPDFVYRVLPKSMSEVWNDVWDRWSDNFQIIVFIKKRGKTGGWGGIRTHGELAPTPVFKTGALNRSATHPGALLAWR